MASTTIRDSKYYHLHPVSDIVRRDLTRDVNCALMAQTPWDGEWIHVDGKVGSALTQDFFIDLSGAGAGGDPAVATKLAQDLLPAAGRLRIVWAHHLRTDRQANDHEAVTTFFQGQAIELRCALFVADDAAALSGQFPAGTMLTVVRNADSRLVFCPCKAGVDLTAGAGYPADVTLAAGDVAVAFAQVVETPSKTGNAANNDELRIRLLAQPQIVTVV